MNIWNLICGRGGNADQWEKDELFNWHNWYLTDIIDDINDLQTIDILFEEKFIDISNVIYIISISGESKQYKQNFKSFRRKYSILSLSPWVNDYF